MKAVYLTRILPSPAFELVERVLPDPMGHDVVIDVHAAGFNPSDVQFKEAATESALPLCLAGEVAGIVAAVGKDVTRVRPGDRVFAYLPQHRSGNAEQVLVREEFVARIPAHLSFVGAAALPVASLTALECVDRIGTLPGSCLVLGAAGGVGSVLLQLL